MIKITFSTLELKALIDDAVDIRERGDAPKAGGILTEVIKYSYDNCFDEICARALGERIVCNKHLHQKENLDIYLNGMIIDIDKGLTLNVAPSDHAVFYLRRGDVQTILGEYALAQESCEYAHEVVNKGGREEAEYLGHLAQAIAINPESGPTNLDSAYWYIRKAFSIINQIDHSELDIKHRLIILSGLHYRLYTVALRGKWYSVAFGSAWKFWVMARDLAYKHGYTMRLEQFWLGVRGKSI